MNSRAFGRPLAQLGEIASTIDYAREWLRAGAPDGAVVIAERQTAGRGRLGRVWASPRGGLWMSVITRPDLEPEKAGRLGIALALAGAEAAAAEGGCQVELKWPNDLVFDGRKVGGVLVDAQISGGRVIEAILSIGININLSVQDLPEGVRGTAASLVEITGRTHSLEEIARRLLVNLDALWPSVIGDGAALKDAWAQRDALAGREVVVQVAGKRLAGLGGGIDEMGRLRLVGGAGEQVLAVGEVTSVRGLDGESSQVRGE